MRKVTRNSHFSALTKSEMFLEITKEDQDIIQVDERALVNEIPKEWLAGGCQTRGLA